MDLQEIAARARLPIRRVRYVLDHRVMPGLQARSGAGRPRTLTALEGFWVAAAGLLLEGGAQRRLVADLLVWLRDTPWPLAGGGPPRRGRPASVIDALYPGPGGPAAVEVADGETLRVVTGGPADPWIAPGLGAPLGPGYAPRVTVRLDLAALRAAWAGAE